MGNHESLIELWAAGWAVSRRDGASAESVFAEYFVNPEGSTPELRNGGPPYAENTYSFDYGNAHFAVVNSNYWYRSHASDEDHPAAGRGQREGWVDDETIAWLDADLTGARERGVQHLFVFTHEPGFPNGGHTRDAMWWDGRVPEVVEQRTKLFVVLGRHGVAAVIHGDEDNYSRTLVNGDIVDGMENHVWQLISGGAGAPYYAQETDVPWSGNVRRFDPRQHFVRVRVDGDEALAQAVSLSGEVIDEFDLTVE